MGGGTRPKKGENSKGWAILRYPDLMKKVNSAHCTNQKGHLNLEKDGQCIYCKKTLKQLLEMAENFEVWKQETEKNV